MRACASALRILALVAGLAALLPWLGCAPAPFCLPGGAELPRLHILGVGSLWEPLAAPAAALAVLPGLSGLLLIDPVLQPVPAPVLVSLLWLLLACAAAATATWLRRRTLVRAVARAIAEPVGAPEARRLEVPSGRTVADDARPASSIRPAPPSSGLKRGIETDRRQRLDLQRVSFEAESPTLRCDFYLAKASADQPGHTLVVKCSGTYRHGSAGKPDARCIIAMLHAGSELWQAGFLVLDLSDLSYVWGADLEEALDKPAELARSSAIVVGELCRPAIATLLGHDAEDTGGPLGEGYYDSLATALAALRR